MNIIIAKSELGYICLTTESPASSYGTPVLRVESLEVSGDFGPNDPFGGVPAAQVVRKWMSGSGRTDEELEAGRKFLRGELT